MSSYTGKAGLITGADSGIGRANALEFARRGAVVAVLDLDEDSARQTGVVGLSKVAAVGYGPDSIRVDALRPALAKTAMFDGVVASAGTQMPAGRRP
ncbi:SDR family NAD(P)-dependent oxidoreductase [Streptomyces sp. AF1A]|jgi:NAD(P)-dependent dehydrogenase (short-subunit alcohol dehydrogenase family)|uniref:SDR family NAD(P)-dependent oxidoreductase n=1 Tax=Streptomyces sp. AF1A TaxID=3394350 RepID=UPI0039BC7B38